MESTRGSARLYIRIKQASSIQRVSIHYHPHKTFGAKLLQDLLKDTGWTESDLKRLKLIK